MPCDEYPEDEANEGDRPDDSRGESHERHTGQRGHRGPHVENQDGARVGMPPAQKPVVKMAGVGGEGRLPAGEPAGDRPREVEERQENHRGGHEKRHHRGQGVSGRRVGRIDLPRDEDARRRDEHAEHEGAGIAHEDPGPVEIVGKKTGAYADDGGDHDARRRRVVARGGVPRERVGIDEESQSGDSHDSCGQPVEPVDEVDGIGHNDHDNRRDEERQPRRSDRQPHEGDGHQLDSLPCHRPGGEHLAGQLCVPDELPDVVYRTDQAHEARAEQDTPNRGTSRKDARQIGYSRGDEDGCRKSQIHGHSAQPRDGKGVHVAFAHLRDCAEQKRQSFDYGNQQIRRNGCDRHDEKVNAH